MRATKFVTIPLIVIFLILGACNSGTTPTVPAVNTPPVTQPPETTPPVSTPPVTTPPATTPPPTTPPTATPPPTTPPPTTPPAVPTGPARFVLSDIKSVPQDGVNNPKWPTLILCTVTNTGGETGTYNVAMTFNGAPYDLTSPALGNKQLSYTLGPGESTTMQLNVTEEEGEFTFAVKAATGDLSLKLKWIER